MPYKSIQQSRYMHAQHPQIAKRWDKETSPDQWDKMPGRLGIKRMARGTCGGTPRMDGSGGGFGNYGTKRQPKKV